MIDQVDEALRKLVVRDILDGSGSEISFEAPTTDWASRRPTTPILDVYLFDICEDVELRNVFFEDVRDAEGRVAHRQPPPRRFALSYMITAWAERPEDEHRLLSSALAALVGFAVLPADVLEGPLGEQSYPLVVTIGLAPREGRATADRWRAIGGKLKPSLDLVVVAPVVVARAVPSGPPVMERRFNLVRGDNGVPADHQPEPDR